MDIIKLCLTSIITFSLKWLFMRGHPYHHSPLIVAVSATVLGSWSERATILTVYASLVVPARICSNVLALRIVTLPVLTPPVVAS